MLLYNPIRFSLAKRIRVIYVKFRRERKKYKNFNAFLFIFIPLAKPKFYAGDPSSFGVGGGLGTDPGNGGGGLGGGGALISDSV